MPDTENKNRQKSKKVLGRGLSSLLSKETFGFDQTPLPKEKRQNQGG